VPFTAEAATSIVWLSSNDKGGGGGGSGQLGFHPSHLCGDEGWSGQGLTFLSINVWEVRVQQLGLPIFDQQNIVTNAVHLRWNLDT
jgi:hypothetical protein